MALSVDVVSDVICPWCFIGKRRLSKALNAIKDQYEFRVTWCPFQLNPDIPPGGMDRKAYRSAKFGSWETSLELDARATAVGATEGIPFAFDRIQRTPNTFDAHRLIWLAQREGIQDAIVEALFRSYFIEAADIGNRRTLIEIAIATGLNAERVERFLESNDGVAAVQEEEAKARRIGISGVPHFIINGEYSLSGAQAVQTMISAFDQAMKLAEVKRG
jgi:predicted DsbA family dithiol-disulfide isomerase